MITIAITGGLGTGKSSFTAFLKEALPKCASFDCDDAVHELLTTAEITEKIKNLFGKSILTGEEKLDRAALREIVFADESKRKQLESLLHPEVLVACRSEQALAQSSDFDYFVVEVPLLYEAEFPLERDLDVVVAASEWLQYSRLKERNSWDEETIKSVLHAQMPLTEKITRADVVVWNEGTDRELKEQALILTDRFCIAAS